MGKRLGVAAILDEYTIIINAGKLDGVSKGDSLSVLSSNIIEIRDPFTDEVLHELKRSKARLKVVKVLEKVSFCKAKDDTSYIFSNINFASNPQKKLRTDSTSLLDVPTQEPIKVGDVIRFD
ncbi:FlgT C-terminal domain-containing protein [Staphylococcus sp. IVB6240]|uniref:FlgT C-terminal domain-containing protein n=1 Tax=Staphylococcus sp. IVB6240 TaxID=2989771 RepID=UPI0021D011F2|nr:FlgT C-terminal domain-containing protein [Staphylococcus sp. IVB6240]UXR72322.1 hypothetical protein MUA88_03855 [Staphylococcus sp. IVB6240]